MAAPDARGMIQVGIDILTTTVDPKTKKILVQLGDVHRESTDTDNAELWQQTGFASRPPKPEAKKTAAQAAVFKAGDHDIVFATQDLRGLVLYGQLDHGETCVYAAGPDGTGQARALFKKDGSINLFTKKGNATAGAGMGIFITVGGAISMASHNGAAILLEEDAAIKMFNGSGGIQIKPDGHIKIASGSKVEISGASITLGGPSALPIAIGPNVVTAIAGLQAQILALQVECAAIATAFVACMNFPGPIIPAHGSLAAGATAAVGVALGLITSQTASTAAATALIPSLRNSTD
jgi:hypothetical protein